MNRTSIGTALTIAVSVVSQSANLAQQAPDIPDAVTVQAVEVVDLRQWDRFVTQGARAGTLRLRNIERDPALPTRTLERFDQFHQGVRIWGADIVRDSERGVPHSIFGALAPSLSLSVTPSLTEIQARSVMLARSTAGASVLREPELA